MEFLPRLEEVEFANTSLSSTSPVDFRSLKSLSVLTFHTTWTPAFPLLPESIRVLDISRNSRIRWSLQDLAASPLPNLESFTADNNPQIENAHVLAILAPSLEKCSLRSLSLCRCLSMDFNSLEWLVKHGENLAELKLAQNSNVTDEALKEVSKLKRLRYLDLSGCGISGLGLMNVANGSPGLSRAVDISGCRNIDWDAVQLATKSGVMIIQRRR